MTRGEIIDWLLKHGFNQVIGEDITNTEVLVYTKGYVETGLVTFSLYENKTHLEGRDGESYAAYNSKNNGISIDENTNELKGVAGMTRRVKQIIYDNHSER